MKPIELPEAVLVCMPCDAGWPLMMPDNGTATCKACGRGVQFRPENPARITKAHGTFAFLCILCAAEIGDTLTQAQN